jgi:hypothetical protein
LNIGKLGSTGFDATRDIEGMTVNRWAHGYAYAPSTLFDPDWKNLRERLRKMPDTELLRFGQAAKFLCRDKNPPETFKLQLSEAR